MTLRTAGFEPAISCSRGTRNARLSHVLILIAAATRERPAGVEPALPPWQGGRLPPHHGRFVLAAELSNSREHQEGLEPSSPHYGCGILAAGRPVLFILVGPVGIEPTSSGLRDRCIALSATVPLQSARKESNPRPDPYKRPALTVELRAAASGAGGTRTRICRIKSPEPFGSATTPHSGRTCSFQPPRSEHRLSPSSPPAASSPGWTRTDHRRPVRSPCFLYNTGPHPVGMVGLEPTTSCSQGTRAGRCPTSRLCVKTATSCFGATRVGVEPYLPGLKGRRPHRKSNGPCSAHRPSASGPGGARIPVSWSSARRYTVSATGPSARAGTKKSPMSLVTPGFAVGPRWWPRVTSAGDARAAHLPDNRPCALGIAVRL
jgi:hypothetical protein